MKLADKAQALQKIDKLKQEIQKSDSIADLKKLAAQAEAIRQFLKTVKHEHALQNKAADLKLEAMRRIGELLRIGRERGEIADQGQPEKESSHRGRIKTLADIGLTYNDSSRYGLLARLPQKAWDEYKASCLDDLDYYKGMTASQMLSFCKKYFRKEELDAIIEDIEQIAIEVTDQYHVIVIDPPWPYGTDYDPDGRRVANPYPEMSLDEISALEMPAHEDCILWLWTTHKFMRHSFPLLDNWGFREVSILTWAKDRMGIGQWLRSQSEFCIMAVKGSPTVNLINQTTMIHAPLREHSRKPDEFYAMVEDLCPGRKAEAFARQRRPNWDPIFSPEKNKFQ